MSMKYMNEKDLAIKIGCSVVTLSKVLNNRTPVSRELQTSIFEVFRGMTYRPWGRVGWDSLFRVGDTESVTTHKI